MSGMTGKNSITSRQFNRGLILQLIATQTCRSRIELSKTTGLSKMTVTNIIYTYINMKTTDTGQNQMPGMKLMMYFMPLMFLFIFNDYASGLSYYYFISTLITIAQTLLFRAFVNEEKLLAQLRENAKNPKKQKKSREFHVIV